jgi:hypothetical protein
LQDTSASSPPDTTAAVCGALEDSGVSCFACAGRKCCGEINTCARNPDGPPYEDCVVNCITARDAGTAIDCQDSCARSHANGAAACQAYLDCFMQQCFNPGCSYVKANSIDARLVESDTRACRHVA